MKTFKAGVIGTGFIGVAHVEALRRLGNVEVVAIADSHGAEEKAANMSIPNWFSDYKEMLEALDIDVVHICTPNDTHHSIAMHCMEMGKHVVCEKPLTTTAQKAKELHDFAIKKGLVNAVNFHNRFNPMMYELKKLIQDGKLGEIFSVHGGYMQDWLLYDTDYNWRILSQQSGKTRAVADIGSHWMDLVENVTGLKITEVFAEFNTFHKIRKKLIELGDGFHSNKFEEIPIDTEDIAYLMFRFNNGARGNAVISQMAAGKKNKIYVNLEGSKEFANWDSENINELFLGRRNEYNQVVVKDPSILHTDTRTVVGYPGGHVEGFPDTFKHAFAQIYSSIEDKVTLRDFATFEDGLNAMILCEKIYESAQTGQWVKVS